MDEKNKNNRDEQENEEKQIKNNKPDKKNEDDEPDFPNFGGGNNKKFGFKSIVLLLFVIFLIISLPTYFSKSDDMSEKIYKYTDFIQLMDSGAVKEVWEKPPFIIGKYSTGDKAGDTIIKARMISDRLSQDKTLVDKISERGVKLSAQEPEKMSMFLTVLISWFPMLLLIGIWLYMLNQMNKGGSGPGQIFSVGKTKAKDNASEVKVTFDDVAGCEEAKEELKEVVSFLKDHTKYLALGAKIPKGVLLLGAPGTGKTLLAKAVAGEAGVPFFSISGSEFVEMFVGVGASRVRDLFNKAKKNSPCIIFIDEIDAVARQRGAGMGGGNDEREQTLNQLLVEMDGFGTDLNIIVIAATNRPDVLDSAITRAGRFDRQVTVDVPDVKGREAILRVHAKNKPLAIDVDFSIIARKTPGFVGADLANLLNEAAILAARGNREEITMADIEEASEKVFAGPEKKSRVISEKEKRNTAYHEVGHAIMGHLLPETDPIHKISIIPRGFALGYVQPLPTEDRLSLSKTFFMSQIKMLLGGRAAEKIIFNDITTGASNDIQRATDLARKMVTRYGMSDNIGPLRLGSDEEHPFLGRDFVKGANYSEETAKMIDSEISKIVNESYAEVQEMLIKNIAKLHLVTKVLLEKETLTGKEFEELMKDGEAVVEEVIKG